MLTYRPKKPCKRGYWERYIKGMVCVECQRETSARWTRTNREKKNIQSRKWKDNNHEHILEYAKVTRIAKAGEIKIKKKTIWKKENPANQRARSRKYSIKKFNAVPVWFTEEDQQEIAAIYAEAARLTYLTGVIHHVDHILPLQGRTVSGLHIPNNLQILTAMENRSKSNKFKESA